MRIVKHKNIDLTVEAIVEAVNTHKTPEDVAINVVGDDEIIVEPIDCCSLFGDGDDYETIFYEE